MKPSKEPDYLAAERLAEWLEEQNPVRWPPVTVEPMGEFFPLGRSAVRRRAPVKTTRRSIPPRPPAEERAAEERRRWEKERERERAAAQRREREHEAYRRRQAQEAEHICGAWGQTEATARLAALLCNRCLLIQQDTQTRLMVVLGLGGALPVDWLRYYHGDPRCDLCRSPRLALYRLQPPPGWDEVGK